MNYKSILISKKDKIGTTELNEALFTFEYDENVNVIVINANGRNFCTGIDVNFLGGKTNLLAIVADNARFGATAVNVGLFCMGPAVPLLKSLGRKKTLELILTGDMIDANEAYRIGLVNKVVPYEKLEEETIKFAKKLAKKSPLAMQLGKKSFYKMEDLSFKEALDLTL